MDFFLLVDESLDIRLNYLGTEVILSTFKEKHDLYKKLEVG